MVVPLLEGSDDLKAPPHGELKFYFLRFLPGDLVLPVHDIPKVALREFSLDL